MQHQVADQLLHFGVQDGGERRGHQPCVLRSAEGKDRNIFADPDSRLEAGAVHAHRDRNRRAEKSVGQRMMFQQFPAEFKRVELPFGIIGHAAGMGASFKAVDIQKVLPVLPAQRQVPGGGGTQNLDIIDAPVAAVEQRLHHHIHRRNLRSLQRTDSVSGVVLKQRDDFVAAFAHAFEQPRRRSFRQLDENQVETAVQGVVDGGVGAGGAGEHLELSAEFQHHLADRQVPFADVPEGGDQRDARTAPQLRLHQRPAAGSVAGEDALRFELVDRLPGGQVTDAHVFRQLAEIRQLAVRVLPLPDAGHEDVADFLIFRHGSVPLKNNLIYTLLDIYCV